jgi:photosystem II stability/assembly factor-like uncharacterized protein
MNKIRIDEKNRSTRIPEGGMYMPINRFVSALVVVFLSAGLLLAQKWESTAGPKGAVVTQLAVKGATVIAGHLNRGLFRSTDNGTSWKAVSDTSLQWLHVSALELVGNTFFAGTDNMKGIYRSTDDGATWRSSDSGLKCMYVTSFAAHGAYIFAGTDRQGVVRSSDGGATWIPVNEGLTEIDSNGLADRFINDLEVIGNTLLAGSDGLLRSTDDGATWSRLENNLPNSENAPCYVSQLAVCGNDLYAGLDGGGVYRSIDTGKTWIAVNNGLNDPASDQITISYLTTSGTDIFVITGTGLYRSTDNGALWKPVDNRLSNLKVYTVAKCGDYLFAGTWMRGVYRLTLDDPSAPLLSDGLVPLTITALAASGGTLFAGGGLAGVFFSNDRGATWTQLGNKAGIVLSLGAYQNNVYAHTELYNSGVFRIAMGDSEWTDASDWLPGGASAFIANGKFFATQGYSKSYFSTNGGTTWKSFTYTSRSIFPHSCYGTTIYAVMDGPEERGIARSTNNGKSWIPSWTALDDSSSTTDVIVAGEHAVLAGTCGRVLVSIDKGVSWSTARNGLPAGDAVAFAFAGNGCYASIADKGVYFSGDNGASWRGINDGLPVAEGASYRLLADDSTLYAGGNGLYRLNPAEQHTAVIAPVARQGVGISISKLNGNQLMTFVVSSRSDVRLNVYTLSGRRAATLVNKSMTAGTYAVSLGRTSLPSGTFIVRLEAGSSRAERTFVNAR